MRLIMILHTAGQGEPTASGLALWENTGYEPFEFLGFVCQ